MPGTTHGRNAFRKMIAPFILYLFFTIKKKKQNQFVNSLKTPRARCINVSRALAVYFRIDSILCVVTTTTRKKNGSEQSRGVVRPEIRHFRSRNGIFQSKLTCFRYAVASGQRMRFSRESSRRSDEYLRQCKGPENEERARFPVERYE